MLDIMRHICWVGWKYTFMAKCPLSIYSVGVIQKVGFGGVASIYMHIPLVPKVCSWSLERSSYLSRLLQWKMGDLRDDFFLTIEVLMEGRCRFPTKVDVHNSLRKISNLTSLFLNDVWLKHLPLATEKSHAHLWILWHHRFLWPTGRQSVFSASALNNLSVAPLVWFEPINCWLLGMFNS